MSYIFRVTPTEVAGWGEAFDVELGTHTEDGIDYIYRVLALDREKADAYTFAWTRENLRRVLMMGEMMEVIS